MELIKVIIVEDSLLDYELIVLELRRYFPNIAFYRSEDSASFLRHLYNEDIDAVISDFNLPGFGALPALELLKSNDFQIPFIVVSGALGDERAADAIKNGAFDLVSKNNLSRLVPTMKFALRAFEKKREESRRIENAIETASLREQSMAVVSHDIKSPLSSIQLSIQLLEKKISEPYSPERDATILSYLTKVNRSTQRIKSLISNYIDQISIDSGGFVIEKILSRVDLLFRELEEVFAPIAEKMGVVLKIINPPSQETFCEIDYSRIFQALMNITGNAIKFTPSGGHVSLSFEERPDSVVFKVADSGSGISNEDILKIFDKYWKNSDDKASGTGLGLYISKAIVEAHSGKISVISELSKGTQFVIMLPKGDLAKAPRTSAVPLDSLSVKNIRNHLKQILLIEDDADLNSLLTEFLKQEGYTVTSCFNGKVGFEKFLEPEYRPDLVIVDYQLPDMSGEQIINSIRKIKSNKCETSILLSSAERSIEHLENHSDHTFVLKKPIVFSDLQQKISSILNGQ